MSINQFKLEHYLTQYEFSAPYLLGCSDAESFSMKEILAMADQHDQELWDNLRLGYTETHGMPELREQIATQLYPGLIKDNILCFAGAEEGIFASLHVLCEPEDHVIVLTPCYQSLLEIPRLKGASITQVILREENHWRVDLNEIEASIKPNTKCMVINFPHNPTGQVITQKELTSLITICRHHKLWLFSDEVYRLLGSLKEGWSDPAACLYEKAISLGVMSKAFGLPGLRVGWIACQDIEMLERVKSLKDYMSICNSAPAEILSLIALKNKDKILARNNQIVSDNLTLLDQFMNEYSALFSWVRPEGGCVGVVRYLGQGSVDEFTQALIEKCGVLLLPGSLYDLDTPHFRIGYGRKNMPEALERLKEFLFVSQL